MTGVNTEVTEVVVPGSAQVGVAVSVQVKIKNTTDEALTLMAGGALEYGVTPMPAISFPESAEVAAGETQTFSSSFVMPQADVIVHGYSYYYDEEEDVTVFDDEETDGVTLVAAAPSALEIMLPMMIMVMMMVMVMKQLD